VSRLETEQVIAAVLGGPEHGRLAWSEQNLGSLNKKAGWKRGAIRAQNTGCGMPPVQHALNGM